jgi:hypothetical protein
VRANSMFVGMHYADHLTEIANAPAWADSIRNDVLRGIMAWWTPPATPPILERREHPEGTSYGNASAQRTRPWQGVPYDLSGRDCAQGPCAGYPLELVGAWRRPPSRGMSVTSRLDDIS